MLQKQYSKDILSLSISKTQEYKKLAMIAVFFAVVFDIPGELHHTAF